MEESSLDNLLNILLYFADKNNILFYFYFFKHKGE